MTDLIERLRKASVYEYGEATYSPLGDEAADEIENLQTALGGLVDQMTTKRDIISRLDAEIERLRAEIVCQRNRIASLKGMIEDEEEANR